jgi:glycosyltransferase involved in cell wall biosynthesis
LKELESQYDFTFLVICNEKPSFTLSSLQFTPWKESSEIEDLLQMNIGIMPLENDPWSEGKCGFKIIQYLSLGIPAVASPVGVNKAIIKDGQNGYLCTTKEEWYQSLLGLLEDSAKRTQMGSMGRLDIEEGYSISANKSKFLSFFH